MIKVYGDIMLDRWIIGDASRISPEAPVPVLKEQEQKIAPGGAGNLALNIANLNGDIGVYGSISSDKEGYSIIECFKDYKKINFQASIDSNITTTKNRLVGQGGQHIMRWDREEKYTGVHALHRLLSGLTSEDLVCVSDYNKGTVRQGTIEKIIKRGCKVLVDPKQDPEFYRNAFLVKPNMKEYTEWFGPFKKEIALLKLKEYGWKYLIVTDGANGMHVLSHDLKYSHYKETAQEVADVTGAGDTVLAVLAYYIEQGVDVFAAAKQACYAAARAVEHRGVHVVTHDDLKQDIVFTNGCFDILHKGHIELLKYAKSLGKRLVVGLNSDLSVKGLKGDNRPYNNETTRLNNLLSLPFVDDVLLYDDDTPYDLIKEISPNIIVKGGDYTVDTVVGNDLAKVVIFPTIDGYSTTKTLENMND